MITSWIRFGKSISVVTFACVISLFSIFIFWEFAVGPTSANALINKYLLNPEFQGEPEITIASVGDLIFIIQSTVLLEFGAIFITSLIWLAIANFIRINRPGDANTWVWVWYMVFLFGAAISAVIPIYMFQVNGDELLRQQQLIPSVFVSIVIFGVFFYFIGSLLATPRHTITSVPLATKILFR